VPIIEDSNSVVVIAFRGDVTFWRMRVDVEKLKWNSRFRGEVEDLEEEQRETSLPGVMVCVCSLCQGCL
jgi:hypothetical protein